MIRIRVSAEDLLRTRFAFSPLWEAVASFRALIDPTRHVLHLPWMTRAREELRGLDLDPLWALVRPEGYIPDFLTPPPATPFPDFFEEVERVREVPPERVREEVERVRRQRPGSDPALEAYLVDPSEALCVFTPSLGDPSKPWPSMNGSATPSRGVSVRSLAPRPAVCETR